MSTPSGGEEPARQHAGQSVSISRHLRQPGEDGYLTPNPEQRDEANSMRHRGAHGSGGLTSHDPEPQYTSSHEKGNHSHHVGHHHLNGGSPMTLSWRKRVKHVTWAYFSLTMATGGIANVLATIPEKYRFQGLTAIGNIFFLLNLVFYAAIWAAITLRFYLYPATFRNSFTHPTESLFVPAAAVSFGTILINITQYGVPKVGYWLARAMFVLFWVNAGFAISLSVLVYLIVWSTQFFSVGEMTPVWIFPAYPLLIVGPFAGNLAGMLEARDWKLNIIIVGFTVQGVGFLVAFAIYAAFVYRLMTQKLPKESLRPGMFVSVGPSGFTVAGTIAMANNLKHAVPPDFMGVGDAQLTAKILQVVANWLCLWIWGLAMWFFFVSVGAHWTSVRGNMTFAMNWFSFVFPNTALIAATFSISKAFDSPTIALIGCVMTCLLILTWLFVVVMMFRAIYLRQILWPQKGEDRDEGGFHEKVTDSDSSSSDTASQTPSQRGQSQV